MGLPGSGKTWLADHLQEHIDCVVLNRDVIRDSIFPVKELDYSNEQNELASQVTNQVAEYILARNPDHILMMDGRPFSKQYQVDEIQALADRVGHEVKAIYCWAPDDVVEMRLKKDLEKNENRIANRNMEKYYRIKKGFDGIEINHIKINTSDPFPENLKKITEFLGIHGT